MKLIEFKIDDSSSLFVETTEEKLPGAVTRASGGNQIVEAGQSLNGALQRVRPFTEQLVCEIKQLSIVPNEFEVEFGLKLSGETGVVLAKAAAEGHCKFTRMLCQ